MDILIVLVFVSLVLVGGGVLLLLFSLHQRDFEHAERLSLLPLDDDPESSRNRP
jgi:cbb3-type cytochrome oxidase maturation protein